MHYLEGTATLHTADLRLETNLDEIVTQAMAAGAEGDAGAAFRRFLLQDPAPLDVLLPFTYTFDYGQLVPWVEALATRWWRCAAWRAVTWPISCARTEASSASLPASASRPRVT